MNRKRREVGGFGGYPFHIEESKKEPRKVPFWILLVGGVAGFARAGGFACIFGCKML